MDIEISSPPTPIHPAPNEEVTNELPSGVTLSDANIDLNPDLYDDDVDVNEDEANQKPVTNGDIAQPRLPIVQQLQQEDELVVTTDSDLEDVDINQLQQITLPFNESYQLLKINFDNAGQDVISPAQQSKLINYIDEQLLQIQRKFIKQQTESVVMYSLIDLIQDLTNIINLIWVSIEQKSGIYGQIEYYIKILGDLEDYLGNYATLFNESWSSHGKLRLDMQNLVIFFKFWQKLDLHLSFLIDGFTINGRIMKMNGTETTRLLPIVSRLRILIISKIDMIRSKLKLEISRIFEGVLERT
ncbi:hypothetical protein SBY92_000342 [Candida maltosa Xu316]